MKKKNTKKPSVNVKDLRAKKNPKGGALFMKYGELKGEALTHKSAVADLKDKDAITNLTTDVTFLK